MPGELYDHRYNARWWQGGRLNIGVVYGHRPLGKNEDCGVRFTPRRTCVTAGACQRHGLGAAPAVCGSESGLRSVVGDYTFGERWSSVYAPIVIFASVPGES